MLGAAFFVTVLAVLTAHYFFVERPRRIAGKAHSFPRPLPLRELIDRQPVGVFLQPTFTWAHVRADGDVELGLHPLLLSLAGERPIVECLLEGDRVEKGGNLMALRVDGHALSIRSPLSGKLLVASGKRPLVPDWTAADERSREWSFLLRPNDLAMEVAGWMVGRTAIDWTLNQYGQIRDYLLARSMPAGEVALADGGELPVGALAQLSGDHLQEFETLFLTG